ncbi:hypothetical protein EIP91_010711 [Steccherinum ochraceum]|uniref:DUF4336 domain-containing protein n=1 Tax=Steccherinum ochraceum TaxID=92696 RepID=A0A4R0RCB1_9APHY|nr:hypothetical protein EIP91_010711 [Steccherinum ochraceum]
MSTQNASPKPEVVIREVTSNVCIFSRPLNLYNRLPVGGRSTAIKLNNGTIWLLASTPLNDETKAKLKELGNDVRFIVAPNVMHHLFLKPYKDYFPQAKVIGPKGLNEKKKAEGWQLDAVFDEDHPEVKYGFEDEIDYCFFSGYKNQDVAFFHKASKTAFGADLLFNLPGYEQYTFADTSAYFPVLAYLRPRSWLMQLFIWKNELDFGKMKQHAAIVAKWDFNRWIPCHGNVIENNARSAFKDTYSRYGPF